MVATSTQGGTRPSCQLPGGRPRCPSTCTLRVDRGPQRQVEQSEGNSKGRGRGRQPPSGQLTSGSLCRGASGSGKGCPADWPPRTVCWPRPRSQTVAQRETQSPPRCSGNVQRAERARGPGADPPVGSQGHARTSSRLPSANTAYNTGQRAHSPGLPPTSEGTSWAGLCDYTLGQPRPNREKEHKPR